MSVPARLHDAGPSYVLATAGNVVVFLADNPTPPPVVRRIGQLIARHGAEHPRGVGYLHVVQNNPSAQVPDDETRRAFVEMIRGVDATTKAALTVVERTGFTGAASRAVIAGVMLASRVQV